jgi:DNA-binding response OmpR family regulator
MTETAVPCIMVVNQDVAASAILATALTKARYRVAGPFSECSGASNWLLSETPQGALLNILLTDNRCFDLARQLRSRGVPYVFHSGSDEVRGGASPQPRPPLNVLIEAMSELIRRGSNGGDK